MAVSNVEVLDDIARRKAEILQEGRESLNNTLSNINNQLTEEAKVLNKGAVSSYNEYMPRVTSANDAKVARSAYLNRIASANDMALSGIGKLNANKNIYAAYLEGAGEEAQEDINNLAYNDYVKQAELRYQRERDKVSDSQADKEYKLDVSSYKKSARGNGSGGNSGSYKWKDDEEMPDGVVDAARELARRAKRVSERYKK